MIFFFLSILLCFLHSVSVCITNFLINWFLEKWFHTMYYFKCNQAAYNRDFLNIYTWKLFLKPQNVCKLRLFSNKFGIWKNIFVLPDALKIKIVKFRSNSFSKKRKMYWLYLHYNPLRSRISFCIIIHISESSNFLFFFLW